MTIFISLYYRILIIFRFRFDFMLAQEQISEFHRNGFLLLEKIVPDNIVAGKYIHINVIHYR
jgi:hypothetical protein